MMAMMMWWRYDLTECTFPFVAPHCKSLLSLPASRVPWSGTFQHSNVEREIISVLIQKPTRAYKDLQQKYCETRQCCRHSTVTQSLQVDVFIRGVGGAARNLIILFSSHPTTSRVLSVEHCLTLSRLAGRLCLKYNKLSDQILTPDRVLHVMLQTRPATAQSTF